MAVVVGQEILKLKSLTQATSIVVTHDRGLAFGIADRMAMIWEGEILFVGAPERIQGPFRSAHPRVYWRGNSGVSFRNQARRPNPIKVMKDSIETRLGLFFALAIITALVIMESLGTFAFFKRGYHLQALFKNVQELKVGDAVKMGGVPVGRVENIRLTNAWRA